MNAFRFYCKIQITITWLKEITSHCKEVKLSVIKSKNLAKSNKMNKSFVHYLAIEMADMCEVFSPVFSV